MSEFLEAALRYAEKGLAVIPTLPKTNKPFLKDWPNVATTDKKQIEAWWSENPNYNVAIVTGRKNHLLVVDLDLDEQKDKYGYELAQDWQKEHGSFPEDSWMVKSAHGGYHLYFKSDQPQGSPQALFFENSGVDIRADGACIVAPPSVREDGRCYEWEQDPDEFELQPANEAVWQFIKDGEKEKAENEKKTESAKKQTELPEKILEGSRTDILFKMVCSMQSKGYPDEAIRAAVEVVNEKKCDPPLTEKELEKEVFGALDRYEKGKLIPDKINPELPDKKLVARLEELDAVNTFSWSDKGFAALYTVLFQDSSRYNTTHKAYMHFDGIRWIVDEGSVMAKINAKKMADALQAYAHSCVSLDEHFDAYRKQVGGLMRYNARETIVKDAQSNNAFNSENLDTNNYLINCKNHVLDLSGKKVKILSHNADLLLSKVCNAEYDPAAECPLWEQSLAEIMENDEEKINYIQKIFGIALTGLTREEQMYFFYGNTSRNGKSTVAETILDLLGDYASTISPESLAAKNRDSRQASPDMAKLQGVRMVVASEPPKKMLFDVSLVKTLTGRDRITARHLYENEVSFTPIFKLIINTNYLPLITDDTIFRSERIRVISFNKHFSPEEQNKDLKKQLLDESSGILNWMIKGWYKYQEEGLEPPYSVTTATDQYKRDSDKIGRFIEDNLEESSEDHIKAQAVYERYSRWCDGAGLYAEGRNNFYNELKIRGMFRESCTIDGKTVRNIVPGYRLLDEGFMDIPDGVDVPFE